MNPLQIELRLTATPCIPDKNQTGIKTGSTQ